MNELEVLGGILRRYLDSHDDTLFRSDNTWWLMFEPGGLELSDSEYAAAQGGNDD